MDRGDYSMPDIPQWVEGEPKKSFWYGLETKNRAVFSVASYRCEKCGYLEAYARPSELG